MRYYPIFLDIRDRLCLVVGGGQVGTRKVHTLLQCGARVRLVSPQAGPDLTALAHQGAIQWYPRAYQSTDQDGAFLVIGATDSEALNHRIHQDAEQVGRLCNIADQPHLCNFILPSVVQQGDLTIAISTGGRSPAFAKYLRRRMQREFGPEYAQFLELMGALRRRLLQKEHAPEAHKPIFEHLIAKGLLDMIRHNDRPTINALLAEVVGPQITFETLMER